MDRGEFFAALARLDEHQLRTALWNFYAGAGTPLRAHIEAELDARVLPRSSVVQEPQPWPAAVTQFVALARAGAFLSRGHETSPHHGSNWRSNLQRLHAASLRALGDDDITVAAPVLEELIDLCCETREVDYFSAADPLAEVHLVLSDTVEQLWGRIHSTLGFARFAELAAPQLLRWESCDGWTRTGKRTMRQRERKLAAVLEAMLKTTDEWEMFGARYLDALDACTRTGPSGSTRAVDTPRVRACRRAWDLARWHSVLLDHLFGTSAESLLDQVAHHGALGGADVLFLQSQLAQRRGHSDTARRLIRSALDELPGHAAFHAFAEEVGASRAEREVSRRPRRGR